MASQPTDTAHALGPDGHAASSSIIAGVICGFLAIVQSAGFGLLLLVGESHTLVSNAVGMALVSSAVMAAVAALTSSTPGVVAIAQGIPIAALAGSASTIIANLARHGDDSATLPTVVVAIALVTMIIGATALLLGGLRLGRFIRFVPFPVIGGFLAGSGWLILTGGVGVVAGHAVTLTHIDRLAETEMLLRFGAAAVFLLSMVLLRPRVQVALLLPGVALAAVVVFNVVTFASGISDEILRANGWLISVSNGGMLWPSIAPSDITHVDWQAIGGQLINLPTVVVLTVVAVLMNATGIELDVRRDVDLDRELRSVGLQNLIGGAGGGVPGFNSVTLSALSHRLGARNPLTGLIVSGFCIAALVFGDEVLALVPTPLLGGLLIWIGFNLLKEWLIQSYRRLSPWEYLVIVLIFLVIVLVSFAWGILVGLVAAAILFAVEYGQVEIVRHMMTGQDYQSSNDTSEERREVLRSAGDAILIVRLQGYLFFGTADRLRKSIQHRIERHEGQSIRFLVVDFRRVSGLDSSAVLSFTRLAQLTGMQGFVLVLCGMSQDVRAAMLRGEIESDGGHDVRLEVGLDHALEWCENMLLTDVAPHVIDSKPVPVLDQLIDVVKDRALAEALLPHLERIEIAPGEKLIAQGTPSDDIYFVEQGRAAVELEADGEDNLHVATIGRGSIVGEIAFYLGKPRSASIVAEAPLTAWRFSAASLKRVHAVSPEALIAFHQGMAGMLADRLTSTNQLIRLLAD